MTSRERIAATLNRSPADRPPWIEIGFHPTIMSKILGKPVIAGNLDMNLIANATPEVIEHEVAGLFERVGYDGGWILSSSNSIDTGANPANVVAMGRAIRECRYR